MKRRDLIGYVAGLASLGMTSARARSDTITRLVVPYSPGGTTDLLGRALAVPMGQTLGRIVIVENKPGASGLIASQFVQSAPPDGSALLFTNEGFVLMPLLQKARSYDPVGDFAPVCGVGTAATFLVVHGSVPARTLPELIAYAKTLPDGIEAGNVGVSSISYLQTLRLGEKAGIKILHVPYKGTSALATALLTGEIKMQLTAYTEALSAHAAAGRLRIIATSAPNRLSFAPDVPCMNETLPGFVEEGWFGIFTTRGSPADEVERINAALRKALADADVRARFQAAKMEPTGTTSARFAAMVKESTAKFADLIKRENIPVT
jgi:tripartite-type tricarboxylate transporter receptor subunit TctC